MTLKNYLQKNRQQIEKDLHHTKQWAYFSPAIYCQYQIMLPMAQRYAHGSLIDLGCGDMPYREAILPLVTSYDGQDLFPRSDSVRYVCDLESMTPIKENQYDTALLIEVLEHLPHPWLALAEIYRILKPGGILVLSVPHLSRLHDEPHDYYRYTHYGLRCLLRDAGFDIIEVAEKGSIFSFLGHQLSTLTTALVWQIPVLKKIVYFLNEWLVTRLCYGLDLWLNKSKLLPLGYVVAARKR